MPALNQYAPQSNTTVRASTDYLTSVTSTGTADQFRYEPFFGMLLFVDQSAVSASSAGGGTGTMTHTVQVKDPISGNYVNSTGVITTTTGVATWALQCVPGSSSVSPTSGAMGKADVIVGSLWRISSVASSSATNFTYSIAASYLEHIWGSSS